jgi:hypothetical protein
VEPIPLAGVFRSVPQTRLDVPKKPDGSAGKSAPDTDVSSEDRVTTMQEHHYFVDIEATVDELWQLFWARIPHTQSGDVTIDILYPGDDIGNGLIRHCWFRVPKYLLTGGKGQSWEWLTEVKPKESWKYTAVGRPLLSQAEGFTRLEDIGEGRTRLHFTETYHAFNPLLRLLLEKRVHAFISKDNDHLIKQSLTMGVQYLRKAKAKAEAKEAAQADTAAAETAPGGRPPADRPSV